METFWAGILHLTVVRARPDRFPQQVGAGSDILLPRVLGFLQLGGSLGPQTMRSWEAGSSELGWVGDPTVAPALDEQTY